MIATLTRLNSSRQKLAVAGRGRKVGPGAAFCFVIRCSNIFDFSRILTNDVMCLIYPSNTEDPGGRFLGTGPVGLRCIEGIGKGSNTGRDCSSEILFTLTVGPIATIFITLI